MARNIERLLITGAAGGLGKVARAHLRGRFPHLRLSDIAAMEPGADGEEIVPCDLSDATAVAQLCEGVDAVLHLGGRSTEGDWPTIVAANIQGAVNLWEGARAAGVERVLFASSNHAIGLYRRTTRLEPRSATRPDSRYGVSKVFGEAVAELYAAKHGVRGFCMRIGSCFPEPIDARMLSTWLSYGDFMRLVEVGLCADYQFEVVYGVSANTRNTWWDIGNARRLGYAPQDNAESFAAKVADIVAGEPASDLFQGGGYVAAEFSGDVDALDG
jgi:uronate dehydrogenase